MADSIRRMDEVSSAMTPPQPALMSYPRATDMQRADSATRYQTEHSYPAVGA